jgi:outer membrane protein TolC
MKPSRLRSALCAFAVAIGCLSIRPVSAAVDLPMPEAGMPALEALVRSALAKSPRMMTRDLELLSAQYSEMVVSSQLYPQLGGFYQYQVRDEKLGADEQRQVLDRSYYNLTASQAVWHWGAVRAAARVGEMGTMVAERNLAGARRALALEVRNAYSGLVLQKMGVRNARYGERRMKEALAVQESRLRASEVTEGVVLDFRLRTDEATLAAERAANDLEFAIRAFRRLTGVETFAEADIPDRVAPPPTDPAPLDPGARTGYLKSEALQVADLQLEQGKLNHHISRRALWPKLNAIAGLSQDDNLYSVTQNERINNVATFVGVQVQWTIFDGWASKGRRLQSANSLRQLESSRDDLLASLKDSADQQAAAVGFAWSTYKIASVRHQGAVGGLAFLKENLARGLSSEEQIANAQAALYQAELAANDALARFYSTAARYASSIGADPLIDGTKEN